MASRITYNFVILYIHDCLHEGKTNVLHQKDTHIHGLIQRTTVTSLSAPKDTRCKIHPLCINPGVPFWTCAIIITSSSEIHADVTFILEYIQSIHFDTYTQRWGVMGRS